MPWHSRHAHAAGLGRVETVERLWSEDPGYNRVLHGLFGLLLDQVWTRLDVRDRLLILKKPFDAVSVPVRQRLTTKWQVTEQAAFKMSTWRKRSRHGTRELSKP